MMKFRKWGACLIAVFAVGSLLVGCGQQKSQAKTVKIGIMSSDEPIWKPVVQRLKKENITLKLVEFNDYNQPNQALSSGQLDLNAFQHHNFLDNWNKTHHTDIVGIGNTIIAPLRLFSNKINKVSQIKKGDQIIVPNDPTNEGRALAMLQEIGLIKLNKTALPTVKDIIKNPKKLKITEVDAAQTARSLSDVTAAVVNDSIASDAKLNLKHSIYREKIGRNTHAWINIIAANKKDANNATYKKVVKAYQTAATARLINKTYHGLTLPAWGSYAK